MKELSLHILDLVENAFTAQATLVKITIGEDTKEDVLTIIIEDDGVGMSPDMVEQCTNPFKTTRTTRDVGLGLSLMKSAAERCEGGLEVTSKLNQGTKVISTFKRSHIDRAPLGRIEETLISLLNQQGSPDIIYHHYVDDQSFVLKSQEIKDMLGEVEINEPNVLIWLKAYIKENINELYDHK